VADAPGLVEHRVSLGARVGADDVVALMHPVAGADPTPRVIRAPTPGYVLRQTEHAYVARGQLIGNVGATPNGRDGR
jgi:predicted deacylase